MTIFKRMDHVSIGVVDFEAAKRLFVDVLGGVPMRDVGESDAEGFRWWTFRLGGKKMELVSPTTPGEGGVGRYIKDHGQGFHHLSISVENLKEAIAHFESNGVRVLSPNFEDENWKHCYLHPKDTFGALIQVFEENEETLKSADN